MKHTDFLSLASLYAVQRIANTGSTNRAAATLFRAQSAITRAVQEIENALGHALFERTASGMLPTSTGKVVLNRSAQVFAELEKIANWCALRQPGQTITAGRNLPVWLLNTRRLHLFVTLARQRRMSSAARVLGITQPAISNAIRLFENGTGFALFHRHPRGLLLTPDGETFLLHVRFVLNELRHVLDDVAALHGSIQGSVTVGALPLGRTLILPMAIASVVARYPQIRIVTDESAYELLAAGVRAGDVDFILGALRTCDDESHGLKSEKLLTVHLQIMARRDHPLANMHHLTLKEFTSTSWILPRRQTPSRILLETLFRRMKLKPPQPTVETADLAVIRGLLLRTHMVALVSARQLHYEYASGELVALDIALHDTARNIGLMWRAGSQPSPAACELINAIRLASTELNEERCTQKTSSW